MHDKVLHYLCDCMVDDELDYAKFCLEHPMTTLLQQTLKDLEKEGYIRLDYGDDRILDAVANKRLKELSKKRQ